MIDRVDLAIIDDWLARYVVDFWHVLKRSGHLRLGYAPDTCFDYRFRVAKYAR